LLLDEFLRLFYGINDLWDEKLHKKVFKDKSISEELGRVSNVVTLNDFIEEIIWIKEVYGQELVLEELK